MSKISRGCLVIGLVSIVLSIAGVFFPLEEFIGCNLPFQFLLVSLYASFVIVAPKLIILVNLLRNPVFDYSFSIILVISGIGTIWLRPWGRTFAYLYAKGIIFLSAIGVPITLFGYIKEFVTHDDFWFIDGLIIWGGYWYMFYLFSAPYSTPSPY